MKTKANAGVTCGAGLEAGGGMVHAMGIGHHYEIECYGPDGELKWREDFHNLVPTVGLNKYLDATLKTGLASPAWYVGLVTGPGSGTTFAAGDTMSSHGGWTEAVPYSNGTRPAFVAGTIASGSVDNSASKAVFNINGSATIAGAFMADNSTKSGTTGTLLGVGDFAADRSVLNGDTLNVTITATITAA
jgi:hypothetical protein